MNRKRVVFIALCLAVALVLTACGKDFEGSGNKEAASAEQLAMRLEDSWQKPIGKKRDRLEGDYENGRYTASVYGMEGMIELSVIIKDNVLSVDSIRQDYETHSVGGFEAIRDGVYAKQLEAAQGMDIDGVTGATITTSAIKNALRSILKQAAKEDKQADKALELKDGVYSAVMQGFGGDITVEITVKAGKLEEVRVMGDAETEGQGGLEAIRDGSFAKKLLKAGSSKIDVVAGATITSNAVMDAMAEALKKAQ